MDGRRGRGRDGTAVWLVSGFCNDLKLIFLSFSSLSRFCSSLTLFWPSWTGDVLS
jgi:hypothetical protein